MFDRSDDEWDAIVDDTVEILRDQARLRRVTSYSDVNSALARRGHRPFDFAAQSDRTAMGAVLGDVVKRTVGETRVMLSALSPTSTVTTPALVSTVSPSSSDCCRTPLPPTTSWCSGQARSPESTIFTPGQKNSRLGISFTLVAAVRAYATAAREAMNTSVGMERRSRQVIAIGRSPSWDT
jgi:hypothetical protein